MTKKLQTLLTLLLLTVGVTSAWGDNTVKYSTDGGINWTEAEDLNALTGDGCLFKTATSDVQVQILDDQNLTKRITWEVNYNLTITATKDVTIKRSSLARTSMWFLNKSSASLTIGSSDGVITFNGIGHADNQRIFKHLIGNENSGKTYLTNLTFKNFKFATENSNLGYLYFSSHNGTLILKNVTLENCVTEEDAFIKSTNVNNDKIYLQGAINFDNCTADNGAYMSIAGRVRLGEVDGTSSTTITTSNPISIYWAGSTTSIGTNVIVKALSSMLSSFTLTNTNLGIFGNNVDLKLTQAHTLEIGTAGAATLVLPFESTIPTTPSGLTCYKLTYNGGDNITATAEETTLAANSPVLVTGTASTKYKFLSTATSGDAATGSGQTSAYGVLIGNYDANHVVPANDYILTNHSGILAFRLADGDTNKVQANRAYMHVTYSAGTPARDFLGINFGGETTGIANLHVNDNANFDANAPMYNLAGQRVGANYKGVVIQNGKKYIKK